MGTNVDPSELLAQYDSSAGLVTAIGALLGICGFAYVLTHPEPIAVWAFEFALVTAPSAAIVYGGYWIATRHVPNTDRWTIAKWCIAGAIAAGVLFGSFVGAELAGGTTVMHSALLVILGALGGSFVALFAAISKERHRLNSTIGTVDERQLSADVADPFSDDARTFAMLVSDTRSWYIVRAVLQAEHPLGVEAIADRIASLEGTDPQDVYIDLIHTRVPKLDAEGLIYYNPNVELVEPTSRISTVADASGELFTAGESLIETAD